MEKSAIKFMKVKKNHDLIVEYVLHRNSPSMQVPDSLMQDLGKAITKHMKNPNMRNVRKFLVWCVAIYYNEQHQKGELDVRIEDTK